MACVSRAQLYHTKLLKKSGYGDPSVMSTFRPPSDGGHLHWGKYGGGVYRALMWSPETEYVRSLSDPLKPGEN